MEPNKRMTPQAIREVVRRIRDAYERYGTLIDEQREALERQDIAAVHALAHRRDEVAEEIDRLGASVPPDVLSTEGDGDAELGRLLDGIRTTLGRIREADASLRQTLQAARDETLEAIRRMESRDERVRQYLGPGSPRSSLDIRT